MPAQDLHTIAQQLRRDVITMDYHAGGGHIAGPLSSADLFALLYFGEVAHLNPTDPWWEERDRIVLSAGHYCPLLYASLARVGYFPVEELSTFMQINSRLPGHPERRGDDSTLPGVEATTGPLGQGVSVAVGMALALFLRRSESRVYCVMSDGELQEGQVWEAITFAVRRQLSNLTFIVDANGIQIEHYTEEIVTGEIAAKLEGFGLHVLETDGNDIDKLRATLELAKTVRDEPAAIVMHTTAGKGVSFMERSPVWHDAVITKEQYEKAIKELR